MKTRKFFSVILSMLITLMCMTTVNVQANNQKMTFHFPSTVTASPGQDMQLDVMVKNPISIKEINNMILTVPDGFEVMGLSETSPAFNGTVNYTTSGNSLNFSIASNGSISSENVAVSIYMHVSESCTPKSYPFQWKTTAMSCLTSDGYNYSPIMSYGIVTVSNSGGTTTTTTATTTTTTATTTVINYDPHGWISLNSQPYKTEYVIGEQLDLTGLTVNFDYYNYQNEHEVIYSAVSPMDKPDDFTVDTSDFNPYSAGTYKITVSCSNDFTLKYFAGDSFASVSFEATVKEPETTTTTTTTTTTATTTTPKYTYSIYFVDEETNEAVYGVKYGISTYYEGDDTDHTIKISNGERYYFDFALNKVSVSLTIENPIPNGYYIPDGSTHWELSAENPDLTVYLRKIETTTTTAITTTTETTTTTTIYKILVDIDSYPKKTSYTIGEELDLSGGKYGITYYHTENMGSGPVINMTKEDNNIDTSEFDNTKAGTYKIYIRVAEQGMYAEDYFEVTVSELETTTTTTTTSTNTTTTSTTTVSAYMEVKIESYPTKTAYTVGEELDLSGGVFYADGVDEYGHRFQSLNNDMTNNEYVDTSEFDNTKAGTYKIFIRMNNGKLSAETFFEVTVTDNTETLNLGDVNNDGFIDSVDATAVLIEYAKLSASGIGTFDDNQKKSADLNKDGFTDSVDATLIMMYYAYVSTGKNDTLENWLFTNNI